ncbi:hypothetical protein SAMN04487947_0565 [Halogeometricum rufum]|uniref:Uncharacterized protein n=1 Tax=Halogeometricum rufum TaxID=553469 RepID=A0A1I6G4J0_9EURY|nr:hypothetical protein [Halogeometricum rufum]SFR37133.1 hypothetical protein SAMN04487947_0565 [Halogeometricum rufum]
MSDFAGPPYTDADARAAADGQIDAATLGGQPPSAFDAPSETNSSSRGGGYQEQSTWSGSVSNVSGGGGTGSFTVEAGGFADGIRFDYSTSWNDTYLSRVEVDDGSGFSTVWSGSMSKGNGKVVNFSGRAVTRIRFTIDNQNGSSQDASVNNGALHIVGLPQHTHTL